MGGTGDGTDDNGVEEDAELGFLGGDLEEGTEETARAEGVEGGAGGDGVGLGRGK